MDGCKTDILIARLMSSRGQTRLQLSGCEMVVVIVELVQFIYRNYLMPDNLLELAYQLINVASNEILKVLLTQTTRHTCDVARVEIW